jgi:hypothetical protein
MGTPEYQKYIDDSYEEIPKIASRNEMSDETIIVELGLIRCNYNGGALNSSTNTNVKKALNVANRIRELQDGINTVSIPRKMYNSASRNGNLSVNINKYETFLNNKNSVFSTLG